jgi:hypothetical protein
VVMPERTNEPVEQYQRMGKEDETIGEAAKVKWQRGSGLAKRRGAVMGSRADVARWSGSTAIRSHFTALAHGQS